jgi:hypothetical protein
VKKVRFRLILLKKPTGNVLVVRLLLLQYAIRLTQDNKHSTKSVNLSVQHRADKIVAGRFVFWRDRSNWMLLYDFFNTIGR